jgi:hypothetical protein
VRAGKVVDALLLATVATITFANVRWTFGGLDVNVSDVTASLFVLAFIVYRVDRADWSLPRTSAILAVFFGAFALVYLIGFFNLETAADRDLFAKGLAKFVVHFAFLLAAVAHLARRSERFYWRTLGWFVAGFVANAGYGLLELAVAETTGGNLDRAVLGPIGAYQRGGINVFGLVGDAEVYRVNALTLDPNHLGVMLVVPLLVLFALYLRLPAGHRWRMPLALTLGFLLLAELATISRSGALGIVVGLVVLAVPFRNRLLAPRVLVPLGAVAGIVAIVVAQRAGFFEQVFRARTSLSGGGGRVHLELYELLPPVVQAYPFFGRGLNTFSTYYEFITGKTNWGPHSYYIALLSETGLVGLAVFAVYLVYLVRRLGVLRRIDMNGGLVRALAWGLTAALAGTLAANAFYLTMQMYYFFVFAMLAFAAPLVFGRALGRDAALAVAEEDRRGEERARREDEH